MSTTTKIVVSSTGQQFTAPGNLSVEQVKSMYGSSLPVINSQDATVEDTADGRTITFRPKTGTKG